MSAQLTPDGKIWACCVRGEELGDMRAGGYDFVRVWRGAAQAACDKRSRHRNAMFAGQRGLHECACQSKERARCRAAIGTSVVESFGGPRI